MLKLIGSLTLVLAVLTVPTEARIGESEVQCEARYGKSRELPIETGGGLTEDSTKSWIAKIYSSHGLLVEIVFDDGVAVFIKYSNEAVFKLAHTAPPAVGLTPSEINHLRKVNLKDGTSWQTHRDATLTGIAPNVKLWKSSDQALHAGYDRDQKKLFVCSAGFWDLVVGAIKDRTKDASSGGAASRFEGL